MPRLRRAEACHLDFDDFFAEYAREVAAMVAVATGDRHLAEDVTQEAMARALRHWSRLSRMQRPDLWVLRVANRLAIDSWRRSRRETSLAALSVSSGPTDDTIAAFWLRWNLERLSPRDRFLVLLRHRDGYSIEEIATRMGRRPNTIAIYLKRARRRLRTLLSEGEG